MCFQHDEPSTHYTWDVREYLHECFPNHWLGCCRPHAWSLRSPDLAPLDYYLCSYLNNVVYETNVDSRSTLLHYIFAAAEHVCNHFHNTISYPFCTDAFWKTTQLKEETCNSYCETLLCAWSCKWVNFVWNGYFISDRGCAKIHCQWCSVGAVILLDVHVLCKVLCCIRWCVCN